MEIEKKKETTWVLKFSGKDTIMCIKSLENFGKIEKFTFSLQDGHGTISVELNEDQFLNLVSILTGFRQGVLGDESPSETGFTGPLELEASQEELNDEIEIPDQISKTPQADTSEKNVEIGSVYKKEKVAETKKKDASQELEVELDPRQWDPW